MYYTYGGARYEVDNSKKYGKRLRINNLCESISIPNDADNDKNDGTDRSPNIGYRITSMTG